MKILLTGSRGYIGTVMGPFLQAAGHEVVGLDTDLYRRSTFGSWKETVPTMVKDIREVAGRPTSRASTRWSTWRRSPTTRSAISTPQLTYDINHLASVRLADAGQGRPACSASCSPPRAATTGRPATRR